MKIVELTLKLICIAILALFGVVMAIIAPEEHRWGYYGFSFFCFLFATVCFAKGGLLEFAISVVASVIVGLGIWYFLDQLINGVFYSGSFNEPSILNAVFFCIAISYPAARVVYYSRFGFGKKNKSKEKFFTEKENSGKNNN